MNSSPYYVTLKRLIDEIGLSEYYMPVDPEEVHITKTDVDRPGLELVGYLKYYDSNYLIAFGLTEIYEKECEDPDISGYGYELTFTLKKNQFEDDFIQFIIITALICS